MGFRRGGVEVAAEAEESMPAAPRNRLRRRKIAERRGNSMLLEEGVRVRTGRTAACAYVLGLFCA